MKPAVLLAVIACSLAASIAPGAAPQVPELADDPIERAMELLGTDPAAARRMIEPLAGSGHAEALNVLAILVENDGPDWKADQAEAGRLREAAVKAGSKAAALNLAVRLLQDAAGDHERAVELLRQVDGVEGLRAPAAYPWARAYLFGYGIQQDLKAGAQYLLQAVEFDPLNVDARFLLGRAYQNGWGMEPDPPLAYRHMRAAADRGDERAQWHAAMMLLQGAGVAADKMQAYRLVRQSAEQGYVQGMISHAVMLATGEGVAEDDAEARRWYQKAAETGSAHALRGLGGMHLNGEGGSRDVALGFALLELAASAGDPLAVQMLQSLRQTESPDRAAVERAKAEWLASQGVPGPED